MHFDRQTKAHHADQTVHLLLDPFLDRYKLIKKLNREQGCIIIEAIGRFEMVDDPYVYNLPLLKEYVASIQL